MSCIVTLCSTKLYEQQSIISMDQQELFTFVFRTIDFEQVEQVALMTFQRARASRGIGESYLQEIE